MRLTTEHGELASAVSWAAQSLSARPAAPALAGLRLAADAAGLAVSGFDYETATGASAPAAVDEPGMVLVSGRLLSEIVHALPNRPVDLATEGSKLLLTCGPYKYTLQTMPLDDYPDPPAMPEMSGRISGGGFAAAVAQVAVAAGRDDTLPFLTGIRIEARGGTLRLVSTNRYRLAVREIPWQPVREDLEATVLIPARTLASLAKALSPADQITLALPEDAKTNRDLLGLAAGGRTATARLLDGEFIRYERIFPPEYAGHAIVESATLIEAVKRIALIAERNTPVRLAASAGRVTVEAGSDQDARAAVTIGATLTGPDFEIAPNPGYLLDGLAALGTPYARLNYTAPAKPVVLTGLPAVDAEPDESYRYLFLPMRVSP